MHVWIKRRHNHHFKQLLTGRQCPSHKNTSSDIYTYEKLSAQNRPCTIWQNALLDRMKTVDFHFYIVRTIICLPDVFSIRVLSPAFNNEQTDEQGTSCQLYVFATFTCQRDVLIDWIIIIYRQNYIDTLNQINHIFHLILPFVSTRRLVNNYLPHVQSLY